MVKEFSIAGLIAGWYIAKKWIDEISRHIEPILKDVEQKALDGVINKADRKDIAMNEIARLKATGKLKLNFLSMLILSKVVDVVAGKLPDFKVSQAVKNEVVK